MAKKRASKKPNTKAVKQAANVLADRLETLLHTIRCIAQHEDELCTLLHDARIPNGITPELSNELRDLLHQLPAEEYAWELHAVQMELDAKRDRLAA